METIKNFLFGTILSSSMLAKILLALLCVAGFSAGLEELTGFNMYICGFISTLFVLFMPIIIIIIPITIYGAVSAWHWNLWYSILLFVIAPIAINLIAAFIMAVITKET